LEIVPVVGPRLRERRASYGRIPRTARPRSGVLAANASCVEATSWQFALSQRRRPHQPL